MHYLRTVFVSVRLACISMGAHLSRHELILPDEIAGAAKFWNGAEVVDVAMAVGVVADREAEAATDRSTGREHRVQEAMGCGVLRRVTTIEMELAVPDLAMLVERVDRLRRVSAVSDLTRRNTAEAAVAALSKRAPVEPVVIVRDTKDRLFAPRRVMGVDVT